MKKIFAVALVISLVLTGCAGVPDLSDEDSAMISHYIAGEVLNSSERYGYQFNYDRSVLRPTPAPTVKPSPVPESTPDRQEAGNHKPGGSSQGAEPVVKQVSLGEIYNIGGINVKPVSVKAKKGIVTSYSSVSPESGKKLVVVTFQIKNNSSGTKKVNLSGKNINYSITIGGKDYGVAKLTILEGDMLGFNEKIAAGKSKKGLLVFQVDKPVKLDDIVVTATDGSRESVVKIK